MIKVYGLLAVILVIAVIFVAKKITGQERSQSMNISSHSFKDGEMMDSRYTCDGKNISPQLSWTGAPEGTKSFAVSCIDPDAPMDDFIHWLVYNIAPDVTLIPEGGPIPPNALELNNDFRKKGYGGPCPPSGVHRYYFTVYALDTNTLSISNKQDFISQMEKHSLARAQIMGRYTRKK